MHNSTDKNLIKTQNDCYVFESAIIPFLFFYAFIATIVATASTRAVVLVYNDYHTLKQRFQSFLETDDNHAPLPYSTTRVIIEPDSTIDLGRTQENTT